jgi:hypothetical protein
MPKSNKSTSATTTAAAALAATEKIISKKISSGILQRIKSYSDIKKRGCFKSAAEVLRPLLQ